MEVSTSTSASVRNRQARSAVCWPGSIGMRGGHSGQRRTAGGGMLVMAPDCESRVCCDTTRAIHVGERRAGREAVFRIVDATVQ